MKFSALNKEASNSSILSTPSSKKGRPTQEAQESACLKLYHNAMKLQQEGKWKEAKAIYCELLESEVMEEGGGDSEEAPPSSTILRLKFLIYKNIASIAREQGDLSAATDAYIEATSVDRSDVTVWNQLASMGSLLGNLLLARKSLEQALCCHPSYWPAIENLCTVLYALGDFSACLHVIGRGLELNPRFPRGLVYLRQIVLDSPDLLDSQCPQLRIHLMTPQPRGRGEEFMEEAKVMWRRREALNGVIALRDSIVPPKKLSILTLSCLANSLLSLYKHCKELSQKAGSYTVPVDLSQLIEVNQAMSPAQRASLPTGKGSSSLSSCNGSIQSSVEGLGKSKGSGEEGRGSGRRETKRKLLDALEPFAPKRRSSRMLTRRKDKDHKNYFEMLSKYLPSWFMMKELPEISEFSPLKKPKQADEDMGVVSERKRQVSALIDSTPFLLEAAVVRRFVSKFQSNAGVIQLLYQFVKLLALHYDHKWCQSDVSPLARIFVDIYESLHPHLCYPSPLCSPLEAQEERFKQVAMVALCYIEMYIDTLKGKRRTQTADSTCSNVVPIKASKSFLECLSFVEHCDGMVGSSALEKVRYTLRVRWCVAKWYVFSGNHDIAIQALSLCKDLLQVFIPEEEEEEVWSANLMVYLPNCSNGAVISLDHVTERLRDLEQSISLKQIQELFDCKEYSNVVQKLLPFLEYNTSIPNDFLLGTRNASVPSGVTNLTLLLDSLLHLEQYHSCLQTAVQATLQLLQNYHLGNDLWTSALRSVFRVMDKCLSSCEGYKQLREQADVRLLKRLMVCVLKAMDIIYDMADTEYFFYMPINLPWKIFYIIISNDWQLLVEESCPDNESPMPEAGMVKGQPEPKPLGGESVQGETIEMASGGCGPSGVTEKEEKRGPNLDEIENMDLSVPLPPTSSELTNLLSALDAESASRSSLNSSHSPLNSSLSVCSVEGTSRDRLSPRLQFLCESHAHLGKMGWCCKDAGSFLLESVSALRKELQILTRLPPKQREVLLQELEQCYYCLYGHPNKRAKVRGLVDHGAEQIPLKWESALMLIEHYHPTPLPSIDDAKSPQVTAEVISLYKRIIEVLPEYGRVITREALDEFIEGRSSTLVDLQPPHQQSCIVSDVFYILADDALKSMDNHKAIRYYQENLCYCPDQFDSWAGMALGRSRTILEKLNQRNFKSGMEKYIRKHTSGTRVCFEKAISLNSKHCYIVEKFGFFCYAVQSFASQILHQPRLFILSGIHPWASTSHQELLKLAQRCFTGALSLEGTKHAEPWIYHWMLGKIGYKLQRPIKEVMANFMKSAQILFEDGAAYPELVEISSRLHAVEAVEVHYQLHSIALKYLLQFHSFTPPSAQDDKRDREERVAVESSIAEALVELKELPLCRQSYPSVWEWTKEVCGEAFGPRRGKNPCSLGKCGSGKEDLLMKVAGEEEDMDVGVIEVSKQVPLNLASKPSCELECESVSERCEVPQATPNPQSYVSLVRLCLYGTAVCAARYPAFFKPLYRMATTLHAIGLPSCARQVLLGPLPQGLLKSQEKLQPLFVLKSNIFTNMWQVPSEEINRPGSFSSHARRCLELLLLVLSELKDMHVLLQLAQHLKSKPDPTKQYLRDNERVAMHTKVVKLCVQVLVSLSKESEFSVEDTEKHKTISIAIRGMANKLDSGLIKELDEAITRFQAVVNTFSSESVLATASSDSDPTTPLATLPQV